MDNWWTKGHKDYYDIYKVGDTEVIIAGRPDMKGVGTEFFQSVDAWMNLSDRFIEYPAVRYAWFPWVEDGRAPPKELLYGALKTLHYWIDQLKLKRIYVHCDAGTHRSPSTFGAYLHAYHGDTRDEIAKGVKLINKPRGYYSCPNVYWNSYLEEFPQLLELIKAYPRINSGSPDWGHYGIEDVDRQLKYEAWDRERANSPKED